MTDLRNHDANTAPTPERSESRPAATMSALRIHGYGQTPQLDDVPVPQIGPNDVLVRVAAAALNPLDAKMQQGSMRDVFPADMPYVLGTDLAGIVERVGSGVTGWSAGDQALARSNPQTGGALAQFASVPADLLVAAPTGIDLIDAAALGTTAATAWQALVEVADLKSGQRILIHGAAGGVGSFAVQFAKQIGAHVTATATGPGLEVVRGLGADDVIDYTQDDFATRVSDVDVVLDTVGGEVEERSLSVLRPGGLLVGLPVPPDEARAAARGVRAVFFPHASDARRLEVVVQRVADSGLTILVDRRSPLSDAVDAWTRFTAGLAGGKVLLLPSV